MLNKVIENTPEINEKKGAQLRNGDYKKEISGNFRTKKI